MTLVVCSHYNDIQDQGNKMIAAMVLISLGVVLIFIILTVVITQKISRPLRRLARVAKTMGMAPDLMELEYDSCDEIGVLYQVFNASNRRLYEYMSDVQSKVYRDSLTGMKNRAAYAEAVKELETRLADGSTKFAVAVFDLNNLKQVNDKYGHDRGNKLLILVSKLIAAVFHRSLVYRIGGDEFVLILEESDYEEYETLIEQFDKLCARECLIIEGEKIPVSVAHGIARYNSEIDSGYENVFHRADGLMYRHKRERKNI
jgi:diguanylate cyclase (GGDEF)-like protein